MNHFLLYVCELCYIMWIVIIHVHVPVCYYIGYCAEYKIICYTMPLIIVAIITGMLMKYCTHSVHSEIFILGNPPHRPRSAYGVTNWWDGWTAPPSSPGCLGEPLRSPLTPTPWGRARRIGLKTAVQSCSLKTLLQHRRESSIPAQPYTHPQLRDRLQ